MRVVHGPGVRPGPELAQRLLPLVEELPQQAVVRGDRRELLRLEAGRVLLEGVAEALRLDLVGEGDQLDEVVLGQRGVLARHTDRLRQCGAQAADLGGEQGHVLLRVPHERLVRVGLLAEMRMVVRVEGGVLALPLLARYRNVVVQVRRRKAEPTLFDLDPA